MSRHNADIFAEFHGVDLSAIQSGFERDQHAVAQQQQHQHHAAGAHAPHDSYAALPRGLSQLLNTDPAMEGATGLPREESNVEMLPRGLSRLLENSLRIDPENYNMAPRGLSRLLLDPDLLSFSAEDAEAMGNMPATPLLAFEQSGTAGHGLMLPPHHETYMRSQNERRVEFAPMGPGLGTPYQTAVVAAAAAAGRNVSGPLEYMNAKAQQSQLRVSLTELPPQHRNARSEPNAMWPSGGGGGDVNAHSYEQDDVDDERHDDDDENLDDDDYDDGSHSDQHSGSQYGAGSSRMGGSEPGVQKKTSRRLSPEERRRRRAESNRLSAERSRDRRRSLLMGLDLGIKKFREENVAIQTRLREIAHEQALLRNIIEGFGTVEQKQAAARIVSR
ncbi:hypothetical protein FVE85_8299 [Porphyridium purpureum]|uniref:BZIP domain-containing protein n=1 Tax=Porphyridium purpureum TaxID=35688 RepID=A0A5J4YN20_PORPP|nr:hypothetical protein FVE85_8299 [Porphyridium purpureum]|eukprot:POR8507..scf244_11